jgi:hypothetical protein
VNFCELICSIDPTNEIAYQWVHEPELLLNGLLVLVECSIILYLEEVAYEALGANWIGAWPEWEKKEGHVQRCKFMLAADGPLYRLNAHL